jgi:type VI protein secretion system component Hcp
MSQPTKPTSHQSEAPEKPAGAGTLPDSELEKVSGGKVTISDIKIVKQYDKSSPTLGTP